MDDILTLLKELKSKAKNLGDLTAKKIGIQENEPPTSAFAMIFNTLTVAQELIHYYNEVWSQTTRTNSPTVEEAKKENWQRIIMIQKMTFIEVMSSLEYDIKQYLLNNPKFIGSLPKRIYLSDVMNRSMDKGIISEPEHTKWAGVIELRNTVVHNNSISETTATYIYPNCQIIFEKGKMIQGNLKLYPFLIDWLLDSYSSWILSAAVVQ